MPPEEPIYEFVRGEGWSIKTIDSYEFTDDEGMRWRLESRRPMLGELGTFSSDSNEWYTEKCKPKLERWSQSSFHFIETTEDDYTHAKKLENEYGWVIAWVTKVPLE